ncbi:MAG: hypothetical protein DRH11_17430 [Deltaproteobacteria bacterium]|nr:MAG: hypothetical protein DRH11_17430 [Deltaproteobacteria bacterium]
MLMKKHRFMVIFPVLFFSCLLLSGLLFSPLSADEGVDLSGFTRIGYLGFLSKQPVRAAGKIVASESSRLMLSEGDIVSVGLRKEIQAHVGDLFTVCRVQGIQKDALKGSYGAYVVSFLGRVVLKEQVRPSFFKAQVVDSFRIIRLNDLLMTFEPVSACVKPLPNKTDFKSKVAALQDVRGIIGQYSVVYLPKGYEQGLRRGNLLEIVRFAHRDASGKSVLAESSMGYMLVVETRPDTATALVITCKEELRPDRVYVRSIDWAKAQEVLSTLSGCKLR